jgi:hypothetical protein
MRVKSILLLCSIAAVSQLAMAMRVTEPGDQQNSIGKGHETKGSAGAPKGSAGAPKGSAGASQPKAAGDTTTPPAGTSSGTNPQALGMAHGILDFCSKVDPKDSATFQQEWATIVAGTSPTQLASFEGSSGYKSGYDLVTGMLGKLSAQTTASGCAGGAGQWKGTGTEKERRTSGQTERP